MLCRLVVVACRLLLRGVLVVCGVSCAAVRPSRASLGPPINQLAMHCDIYAKTKDKDTISHGEAGKRQKESGGILSTIITSSVTRSAGGGSRSILLRSLLFALRTFAALFEQPVHVTVAHFTHITLFFHFLWIRCPGIGAAALHGCQRQPGTRTVSRLFAGNPARDTWNCHLRFAEERLEKMPADSVQETDCISQFLLGLMERTDVLQA